MNNTPKIQLANLTLRTPPRYTEHNLKLLMLNTFMKFLSVYALLISVTIALTFFAWQQVHVHPELTGLFYINALGVFWAFALLGLGLGMITLFIAAIMSWLQLALLATGSIDPHLTEAGFFKVLSTILGR